MPEDAGDGTSRGDVATAQARPLAVPADLVALAQSGAGLALATAAPDNRPVLGLGIACRVGAGGVFRVLVDRAANARLLDLLAAGGPVALTVTATRDHTSFQVKARRARVGTTCSDDLPEMDRQQALLRDGLVELGFTEGQASGYSPYDAGNAAAVEFVPERLFSQTPGPGAGAEVSR